MLGLGLAVLLDKLRKQGKGTTTSRANAFILGRVPLIGGRRDAATDAVDFMEAHPGSAFAHAIASINARLAPDGAGTGRGRAIVVAPLGREEGATSLVLCLAAAAGAGARRILVIDADPARGGLSLRLGLAGRPGLSEVLRGELSATKAVVAMPRFAVLPAGVKRLDAKAAAKALRGFLAEACGRFDLVLVDAPAFAGGMDALTLAAPADGLAVVASWDQLLRDDFISVVDAVADDPSFAGIILNRVVAEEDELALAG